MLACLILALFLSKGDASSNEADDFLDFSFNELESMLGETFDEGLGLLGGGLKDNETFADDQSLLADLDDESYLTSAEYLQSEVAPRVNMTAAEQRRWLWGCRRRRRRRRRFFDDRRRRRRFFDARRRRRRQTTVGSYKRCNGGHYSLRSVTRFRVPGIDRDVRAVVSLFPSHCCVLHAVYGVFLLLRPMSCWQVRQWRRLSVLQQLWPHAIQQPTWPGSVQALSIWSAQRKRGSNVVLRTTIRDVRYSQRTVRQTSQERQLFVQVCSRLCIRRKWKHRSLV